MARRRYTVRSYSASHLFREGITYLEEALYEPHPVIANKFLVRATACITERSARAVPEALQREAQALIALVKQRRDLAV